MKEAKTFIKSMVTFLLLSIASAGALAATPLKVQILSFNDFHGNVQPPKGSDALLQKSEYPLNTKPVELGGSEYLASTLKKLRMQAEYSLTVTAGDVIGGSPLFSGMFHDEPTVESMEALGLDVSSVGNHEFDEGLRELLRMQYGGCHPDDGCYFPGVAYDGADFPWLAANVLYNGTSKSILPKTWVKKINGVDIGFIGMTLAGTPELVSQSGIQGLTFVDEIKAANTAVNELHKQHVRAIVLLLHEGGFQTGIYSGCDGISGPIVTLAKNLNAEIDLIVTGHTHRAYICSLPDPNGHLRHVTSASFYGHLVTETWLTIDRATRDVIRNSTKSTNVMVERTVAPDAAQTALIAKWFPLYEPKAKQQVGSITNAIIATDRSQPSSLGNMIADSWLASSLSSPSFAEIALINPGGIRASLACPEPGPCPVTYEDLYKVLPFGNTILTLTLTGEQLKQVLEEQYEDAKAKQRILGVSNGFTLDFLPNGVKDNRIRNVQINGQPLDLIKNYRVTVSQNMLEGSVLNDGLNRTGVSGDLEALQAYMKNKSPVSPPPVDRVRMVVQ